MHPWMREQLNRQHIEDLRSLGRPFGVSFRWRRLRRQGVARLKARSAADRETNAVELGARGTTGEPSVKRAASSHPRRGSDHRLRRGPTEVALGCSEKSQPSAGRRRRVVVYSHRRRGGGNSGGGRARQPRDLQRCR
jgi:hypothetical protein